MKCPACAGDNPDGKEFCGDCGQPLPDAAAPSTPEAPAAPAPAAGTAPPTAPATQAAQQPVAPAVAASQAPSLAPKKSLTGPIVAIIAGVLLLSIVGCSFGAYLLFRKDPPKPEETGSIVVDKEPNRGSIEISRERGFPSSMAALEDIAEQYYEGSDWWYLPIIEDADYEEYYISPDETTYDKGVIIERRDGEWYVTDIYTVDMSNVEWDEDQPQTDEASASDEELCAYAIVDFLVALQEGRLDDAYDLTAPPLSDLDLSGLVTSYVDLEFLGTQVQDDGSIVVIFTLFYEDGASENIAALCIPGDLGWYISELSAAD